MVAATETAATTANSQTGQKEDPRLSQKFNDIQKDDETNLTIAERLILASHEREFEFEWCGVPIRAKVPTGAESDTMRRLFDGILKGKSSDIENDLFEVYGMVADFVLDDSIDVDFLKRREIGHGFVAAFITLATRADLEPSGAVKNFRII